MKTITFEVPEDVHDDVEREAKELKTSKSAFCREIIQQRRQKEIVMQVTDAVAIARLEGKNEMLTEQLTDANNRLATTAQQAGMAGVEQTATLSKKQVEAQIEAAREKWQNELDKKELVELRAEKKENAARIKELEEHRASNDKFDKTISKITEFGTTVVANNPALVGKLAGLMGVPMDAPAGLGELPEADQHCLDVGRAVVNEIDPSIQNELLFVLKHLVETPADMKAIMAAKPIATALRLAQQQQKQAATA